MTIETIDPSQSVTRSGLGTSSPSGPISDESTNSDPSLSNSSRSTSDSTPTSTTGNNQDSQNPLMQLITSMLEGKGNKKDDKGGKNPIAALLAMILAMVLGNKQNNNANANAGGNSGIGGTQGQSQLGSSSPTDSGTSGLDPSLTTGNTNTPTRSNI